MGAAVCPLSVCMYVFMHECVPTPDPISISCAKFLSPAHPILLPDLHLHP